MVKETEENKLEKNLKKIEETKGKLKEVMTKIDDYHNPLSKNHGDNDIDTGYSKKCIDTRDNLAISLNYLQTEVIIEQNNEIIKYLGVLNK